MVPPVGKIPKNWTGKGRGQLHCLAEQHTLSFSNFNLQVGVLFPCSEHTLAKVSSVIWPSIVCAVPMYSTDAVKAANTKADVLVKH